VKEGGLLKSHEVGMMSAIKEVVEEESKNYGDNSSFVEDYGSRGPQLDVPDPNYQSQNSSNAAISKSKVKILN